MPCLERQIHTRDGLHLSTYCWTPAAGALPKGVVVLTHGHGEYASKYAHVAQAFNAGGYAFLAYDLRGHGRSGGPRGHAPRYEALLSDLHAVHDEAGRQFPGQRVFLYGHSLGGQITLSYTVERRPDAAGVVVSAPWLRLTYQPPAWKMTLARVMANVWPAFTQETGLDTAIPMTHDAALLAAYPDQHLVHARMSARLGMDALQHGEALLQRAGELRLPLLVLHGGADGVFKPETSQEFVERAGAADKTFKVYPGLYHEIHNEIERAQVFQDLLAWLDRHSA
jgi:alpha-beta hydrolase superfamily lysophospholipase